MTSMNPENHGRGLSLRQAALIAGFAYLLMPVLYAELFIFPKLVIPGNIEQTVQNISAHGKLFFAGILCHLITVMLDVVIAWALYMLFVPVNKSLSLLTAWFRLVYAVVALVGLFKLVTVLRLLNTPAYLDAFGSGPLHGEVMLLLNSFRYDWSMSLLIFGIHLALLGYLICRSHYVPWILGILLALDGLGWILNSLRPYLFPNVSFRFFFVVSFVELIFPLWLVIRGWKIPEPAAYLPATSDH